MKTYADVQERIAGLNRVHSEDEDKNAIVKEEVEALTLIAGSDADDMMNFDGIMDFLWEDYPEGSDFEGVGERLRKWFSRAD